MTIFPALTSPTFLLIGVAILSYLIGSIPFGVLISKMMGLGNLRDIGSGNIGATNVLRTGSKLAAFLTLIFDGAKGTVAVLLAAYFVGNDAAQLAAISSFLGHLYPVWLGFRGGKGVATSLGILLALSPVAALITAASWLVVAFVSRISSLAALCAAVLAPVWIWLFGSSHYIALTCLLALLVLFKHRTNIIRLLHGQEPRIGGDKSRTPPP